MKLSSAITGLILLLALSTVSSAWAVDDGQTRPRFNRADLSSSSTSADIIPLTSGSGNVKGFQCEWDTGVIPNKLQISFYVDGGSAQSTSPWLFPVQTDTYGGGPSTTAFIPMNVRFGSSIRAKLDRLSLSGTGLSGCVVSWGLD
jgi:hypothetical protein